VEIVDKNVAARGGLQAWRAVQTMTITGKLGAGGNERATLAVPVPGQPKGQGAIPPHRPAEETQLPFVMDPTKVRFELEFNKETAIQVFDGVQGWKLRPYLNRKEVEPFSPEEMKTASKQGQLDGLLIDYAAKGTILSPPRECSGTASDAQGSAPPGNCVQAGPNATFTTASCPPSRRGDEHAELLVAHYDRRGAHC
jgi:hypothetical protein